MVITDKIRSLARQTLYVVAVHTILYAIFFYAHGQVDIRYSIDSFRAIMILFLFGPLIMVFFLTKESARQWAIVLIGLLMAELVYNIYTKFSSSSPLTIMEPDLIWQVLYEASFGIVLVLEVIGVYLTIKILKEIHGQITSLSGKSGLDK